MAERDTRTAQGTPPREREDEPRIVREDPPVATGAPRSEPAAPVAPDGARIVREERAVGPYGEEEVVAVDDRGRRWYSLRPMPAANYDYLGFGVFWWVLLWCVIIGLIIWGWGWGW